ncbi:NTP transferase domain-containing protein [Alphaproteobacteria bacterium endosymbiont of Tiliacea citrago]|uniref:NTP transferase domain-containing protein n=1 Tax=Alphaproteobacteria bacterium endosymbiont of Tiliacea citrago TaxID=3077944 RepID=UPI00313EB9F0
MNVLILAGGLGSRFFSNNSKISVNFWGIPIVKMLCLNAQKISEEVYVVLRNEFKDLPKNTKIIYQKEAYGTGAAVQSYYEQINEKKSVLIIPGDAPLVDHEVMKKFKEEKENADIILGIMKTPKGMEYYGRVFIKDDEVEKILEYKQYKEKTKYVNTGIILLNPKVLHLLNELTEGNNKETYLTEIIAIAKTKGFKVKTLILTHEEALGFNTISEFHKLLGIAQSKWRKKALESKAIFFDIKRVYLSYDTAFELGSVIEPYTRFLPGVKIGPKGTVRSFSSLENCYINGTVGPFSNIKSGEIHEDAEIGSFVEVNRSVIGKKSKAKHLSYLGDAKIGTKVNIGAGCVICNYDGKNKHKTEIGSNSLIGGNTTLIAPINVGEGSLLAAGSTFTENVEDDTLAIARSYQTNKPKKK